MTYHFLFNTVLKIISQLEITKKEKNYEKYLIFLTLVLLKYLIYYIIKHLEIFQNKQLLNLIMLCT